MAILDLKYIIPSPLLLMCGIISALFTSNNFLSYHIIMSFFLPIMVIMLVVWRDTDNAALFALTLPCDRSQYLMAKFIIYWLIIFYGFFSIGLMSTIITLFNGTAHLFLTSYKISILLFTVQIVSFTGVFGFPLMAAFRKKALLLMMFFIFGLVTFLVFLTMFLFRKYSLAGDFWLAIIHSMKWVLAFNKTPTGMVTAIITILTMNSISLKFMSFFFARENF